MNPPAGSAAGCCPARRAGLRRARGTTFRDGQGWSQVQVGRVDDLNREHGPMRQDGATRWRGPGCWWLRPFLS